MGIEKTCNLTKEQLCRYQEQINESSDDSKKRFKQEFLSEPYYDILIEENTTFPKIILPLIK